METENLVEQAGSASETAGSPVRSALEIGMAIREAIDALDAELLDEAILACERALKSDPLCPEAVFLLGLVTFDLDEPGRSIALLEKAHELSPQVQEFAEALAAIEAWHGKVSDALFYAKLATTLPPHPTIKGLLPERFGTFFRNLEAGNPQLYLRRAEREFEAGRFQQTAEHCRRQLELTPGDVPTLRLIAAASLRAGRMDQSLSAFRAVLHAGKPHAEDLSGLACALSATGRADEAMACHRAALDLAPEDRMLHSRYLADLVRQPGSSAAHLAAAHAEWRERHAAAISTEPMAPGAAEDPDRPLRVAYFSGAFYGNDFVELFEPVLRSHRRAHIQAYCYSDGTRSDAVTERLMRSARKWTDITGIDDETLWQILRGDEIDIAVDLSGHFEGGRPLLFARHAAPVTLSWLGYPYPPNISAHAHFVTDEIAWPAEDGASPTGAALWRLPRAAFAYLNPGHMPEVGAPPATLAGHITFGASCDLATLSPALARQWATVLWTLEGARLLICNRFNLDQACIERCAELFSNMGLRNRIDIVNMEDNFRSGFEFYHHLDVALDTGAPGSRVENCRALWMGVPVVALAGAHHATRQGASLLVAADHAEWVAQTAGEVAAIAHNLTSDLGRLASLRAGLRDQVSGSALADVAGLTHALEHAYRTLWRRRCAGDKRARTPA